MQATPGVQMKTSAASDTRNRLVQTAAKLMWERSFQATGVDELCQRAHARKGSFYHFFSSKSDLAIAAIENAWALTQSGIFEPILSSNDGGLNQLSKLVNRVYESQHWISAGKGGVLGCPFGSLGQEMARQDERIRASLQKIFEGHCHYIEEVLDRAVEKGEIPKGDNRQRAENIFALLEGALLLAKVTNDLKVFRNIMGAVSVVAAA